MHPIPAAIFAVRRVDAVALLRLAAQLLIDGRQVYVDGFGKQQALFTHQRPAHFGEAHAFVIGKTVYLTCKAPMAIIFPVRVHNQQTYAGEVPGRRNCCALCSRTRLRYETASIEFPAINISV